MNIPSTVKVGYKDYSVTEQELVVMDARECYGTVSYNEERIKLKSEITDNQKKCTLIHEIIHAIDDMHNIGLKEEQVLKLGKGMYQVIKDNPDMFKS